MVILKRQRQGNLETLLDYLFSPTPLSGEIISESGDGERGGLQEYKDMSIL